MPEINPYEPPQTENLQEQTAQEPDPLPEDVSRSLSLLIALQLAFVITFAICFLAMPVEGDWLWSVLRSVLLGNALTSIRIGILAASFRGWGLLSFEVFWLIGSCILIFSTNPK